MGLDAVEKIVRLLVDDLNRRLVERGIVLEPTEAFLEWVSEKGYDPVYGARPLKRFLQKRVETGLARKLISGEISDNSRFELGVQSDELSLVQIGELMT